MSSRSFTVPVLAAALLFVAGCDRQSPDAAQPQSAALADKDVSPQGTGMKGKGPERDVETNGKGADSPFTGSLDTSHRGARMPDLTFTDPAGRKLHMPDLVGKPLLVNLWATWCTPCVLEMPMLDKLAAAHAAKIRVLTVSQDMEGTSKVAPFFAEKNFRKLEPWIDSANDLGFHYNTGVLPTTVLYDAQGREVWRMVGAYDWASPAASTLIMDALAGRNPAAR